MALKGFTSTTIATDLLISKFEHFSIEAIDVADINGDGRQDLLIPYIGAGLGTSSELAVLLGDTKGTFQPATYFPLGIEQVASFSIADLNGDGRPDVVASAHYHPLKLSVLLNNGAGGLTAATVFVSDVAGSYFSDPNIILKDVNNDNRADLIVTDDSTGVTILLGKGDGTFGEAATFLQGFPQNFFHLSRQKPVVADFDRDGRVDVLVSGYTDKTVSLFLMRGDGQGGFGVTSQIQPKPRIFDDQQFFDDQQIFAVNDFNGDAILDIAATRQENDQFATVSILLGDGTGAFTPGTVYSIPGVLQDVQSEDLDQDGKNDLFLSLDVNGTALMSQGDGTFQVVHVPRPDHQFALSDFNGDGILDIVNASSSEIQIMYGGAGQTGSNGGDFLRGTSGKDRLVGLAGDDALIGDASSDTLIGGAGDDVFVYEGATRADVLKASLLSAPDWIKDINHVNGFDQIELETGAPRRLFNAGVEKSRSLKAAVRGAYADKNQQKKGRQVLGANEAVFFQWNKKTFLSVNDSYKKFSASQDMLINVTGIKMQRGEASAGILNSDDYFS